MDQSMPIDLESSSLTYVYSLKLTVLKPRGVCDLEKYT